MTNKKNDKIESQIEEVGSIDKNERVMFDIEGKLLLVRVGSADRPANGDDIEEVENKLVKLLNDNKINCAVLVTHHAVTIDLIEPISK